VGPGEFLNINFFTALFTLINTVVLCNWTLSIRSVSAPENTLSTFYESAWRDEESVRLAALLPWYEIKPEWEKICGIGIYETEFELYDIPDKVIFKPEFIRDTYEITVNGILFDCVDPVKNETDITRALKRGVNTVCVSVASTLMNIVSLDYLRENEQADEPQKSGMWGECRLQFYRK
jgi:hypothetical protein